MKPDDVRKAAADIDRRPRSAGEMVTNAVLNFGIISLVWNWGAEHPMATGSAIASALFVSAVSETFRYWRRTRTRPPHGAFAVVIAATAVWLVVGLGDLHGPYHIENTLVSGGCMAVVECESGEVVRLLKRLFRRGRATPP